MMDDMSPIYPSNNATNTDNRRLLTPANRTHTDHPELTQAQVKDSLKDLSRYRKADMISRTVTIATSPTNHS